jgi:hypothetical protein
MASVQERLKAAMEASSSEPIRLPFPSSTDGSLVVRYRPVRDWAVVKAYASTEDPAEELNAAADTLLASCEGCEAHIDGEVTKLPHKLGLALAEYLDFDVTPATGQAQAMTDRHALFLMCPNSIKLIKHHDTLLSESEAASKKARQAAEGESQAS